jgi:hypothetical protein
VRAWFTRRSCSEETGVTFDFTLRRETEDAQSIIASVGATEE